MSEAPRAHHLTLHRCECGRAGCTTISIRLHEPDGAIFAVASLPASSAQDLGSRLVLAAVRVLHPGILPEPVTDGIGEARGNA